MAVTYAWRLDSDKYAYILPPYSLDETTDISPEYGFLSKSPLTDYALRNVAEEAESRFGKSNENGLDSYIEAFMMMEAKIKLAATGEYEQAFSGGVVEVFSGWTSLQNADFLSADMYYNVDSTDCADLRGVGIKGTRYLGSITGQTYSDGNMNIESTGGVDMDDIAYIAAGSPITMTSSTTSGTTSYNTVVRPGMAGFTDVYGIYLTDNIEENGEVRNTTTVPEYMFVIRNGMNGPQGEKGDPLLVDDSSVTETLVTKEEFNELATIVSGYSGQLTQLNENVRRLATYYDTLSLDNVNNLMVMVSRLEQQMASLKEYVFNLNVSIGGGYSDGEGGTSIEAIPLGIVTDSEGNVVCNDYEINATGTTEGNISSEWSDEMNKLKSKKFHLLGYLENDEDYLKSDGGYRKAITIDRLYVLPNIGVSLTGVTFGVENEMSVLFNGDVQTMGAISATTASFASPVYSDNGFYQANYTGPFKKVDTLSTDDFKEPE